MVPRSNRPKPDIGKIISPDQARMLALRSLEKQLLVHDERFRRALAESEPGEPVLVQRLDKPDNFYYLVPLVTEKKTSMVVSLDALNGEFLRASAFPKPVEFLTLTRKAVEEMIVGKEIEVTQLGREEKTQKKIRTLKIKIRRGAYCFYPIMVWRPCQESRSPNYPFYMVTVGERQIFIGYNGSIYLGLHDLGPGGE